MRNCEIFYSTSVQNNPIIFIVVEDNFYQFTLNLHDYSFIFFNIYGIK